MSSTTYPPSVTPPDDRDLQPPSHRKSKAQTRVSGKRLALLTAGVFIILLGVAYNQRDRFSVQAAELSRSIIGDEKTARVESWYFALQDRADRLKYSIFGGSTNPFRVSDASIVAPATLAAPPTQIGDDLGASPGRYSLHFDTPDTGPIVLPETKLLRDNPDAGEGVWSTDGLPLSSPSDVLMAKTFFHPDRARPYATVGVLLIDKRRVRLHVMGGTEDPGGDRGVKGPGLIPQDQRQTLLAAWNGGFRGPHGGFGMIADGKTYRPLRNGLASLAVYKDGSFRMGEWGRDLTWNDDTIAVRQNTVLLVDNCEVSKRTSEGNDTWGYVEVNSSDFITWRSAVGITKNGDLLVAAGNSLSAESLARGLWAAGACRAMQLDINSPYVLVSLFTPATGGGLTSSRFMSSMPDSPGRFLNTQQRDFMYVTLDEAGYKP